MKPSLVAFVVLVLAACTGQAASAPAEKQPVLVELFTSQGCSSCPPADALLSKIGRNGSIGGVPVIALAYHVDYWNYLGWRDPFSAKQWTTRQRRYARAVANGRVYTPQLIINGRGHAVGSQRRQVAAKVRALATTRVIALTARLSRHGVNARVTVSVPRSALRANLELLVAVYENDVRTRVPRGENAGRSLRNDHVVRALKRLSPTSKQQVSFAVSRQWRAKNLGAVAFLRDKRTLAVVAAVRATK